MFACCLLLSLVVSIGDACSASDNSALLSFFAGNSFLFVVSGYLSSFVASGDPLSTILDCFLSAIAGGGPLFAISGHLFSPVADGCCLSTVWDRFLSLVASSGPLSAIFGGDPSSLMLFAGFWALFLTGISSLRIFLLCFPCHFSIFLYLFWLYRLPVT